MNEKLKDKVVAIELAGNNILLVNDNDNFKNELISLGFEKVEPYYSISMPIDDVEKRSALFQKLMEIGTLFSNGRDWSPSEIVRYYRDKGLIKGDYLRIVWRNEQVLILLLNRFLKLQGINTNTHLNRLKMAISCNPLQLWI